MILNEFKTSSGEIILYTGKPDFAKLETLSNGYGDLWHTSLDQGYRDAFGDIVYQSSVFFWYINDFEGLEECVSWRVNPNAFAVRKSVWNVLGGFDTQFDGVQMQALDFGFGGLRFLGLIPLYVKNLFTAPIEKVVISTLDRYRLYFKYFKKDHALFMLYRKGIFKISEWSAYLKASKTTTKVDKTKVVPARELKAIVGTPNVSYIIPTMLRQDYTLNLLNDLAAQTLLPTQVVIVDATPEGKRIEGVYQKDWPFELILKWQETKGSCRARNEAIELCSGEYIVFGDDDIRVLPNFIENHVRILQTYKAAGCNGLDIRADNETQILNDLSQKVSNLDPSRYIVGSAQIFSNANSCVKREAVNLLSGNDINYDGGYGEDGDFALSLIRLGIAVLQNPFSVNLHLKPPAGGYRFWGTQAKILGKKRKAQPWELDTPVKQIRPVPSPTLMYQYQKHFRPAQILEYRKKYFAMFLFKGPKLSIVARLFRIPYKQLQFERSVFYAKKLLSLGTRTK